MKVFVWVIVIKPSNPDEVEDIIVCSDCVFAHSAEEAEDIGVTEALASYPIELGWMHVEPMVYQMDPSIMLAELQQRQRNETGE